MSQFDICLAFTLREEGGYQCLAEDAGNWTSGTCNAGELIGTCYGISAPVLVAWQSAHRLGALTQDYMRTLPIAVATAIYGQQFWLPCGGPQLPAGIDVMVFDHSVNAGVHASVRLLQSSLGTAVDGYVGPITLAAAGHADPWALVNFLNLMQGHAYRGMRGADTFLTGWLGRLARRRAEAERLLPAPSPRQPGGHPAGR